ncbi:tetratricopeptide repeat protein [Sorangium sp. So ce854]|uniref:tetratricopeptide repeat protein n=1 Tax=Sorangium sp. So ce854 TaxID=3133322 RepID=UPI003F648A0C
MRHGSVGFYLLLASILCASSAAAQATQTSPQQDKAVAVALAEQGWEHYQAHRYTEALRAFHEAETKAHAPAFLLMIARCHVKLGRLLDARAAYQLVVDGKLAPGAPPEFAEAKEDARKELVALEPRIPTVEVAVTGAAPGKLDVTLDGERIALATPVQRDPGHHPLVVRVAGHSPLVRTIWLVEGATERIEIDQVALDALPTADLSGDQAGQHGPRPHTTQVQLTAGGSSETDGWLNPDRRTAVLFTGGAAAGIGLAAGGIFTLLANERAGDADDLRNELRAQWAGEGRCPSGDVARCRALKDAVDASDVLGNAAFWSFVVGGAAGAGALIFGIVTRNVAEPSPRAQAVPFVTRRAAGLSLSGSF